MGFLRGQRTGQLVTKHGTVKVSVNQHFHLVSDSFTLLENPVRFQFNLTNKSIFKMPLLLNYLSLRTLKQ